MCVYTCRLYAVQVFAVSAPLCALIGLVKKCPLCIRAECVWVSACQTVKQEQSLCHRAGDRVVFVGISPKNHRSSLETLS